MVTHTAQVRGRKIAWDKREVVQHGLNADRIKFDLDSEFRGCDSYQVVLCGPSLESPKRYIPDKDMTVAVPPSLMESTGPVSTCLLGYVGGEVRVVTAQERYPLVVVESGFTGPLDPGEEQPDLWAQIMSAEAARIEAELVREAAETARADAEAKRIAAEKARETASAEAVKAANEAAAKAEQAARRAEDRVTAALAEVAEAEQARTEAEKARAAAESSRAEAEAARIAAESKRESAEAKRKADSAKAVADASAATSAANAAAGKADAAAQTASDGEASRVAAETARAKAEQARAIAETGRVEAEATRAANESERTETFNDNLTSWNGKVDAACKKATDTASKAAQDAKTATDAAIAKTEEATQAAVAKADKATASATTAANKAEAAVAQLPIPSGNVLKGEAESTFINLHDSWKAPILKGKVLGQSNQLTTTGKNLLGGERYVSGYNIRGFKNILKPNTKYTYSSSGITDGKAAFKLLAFNAQQSKEISLTVGYIKNDSETFTTPENIGEFEELYLGGNYNEAGKKCINSHFQIEEGAKATAYEPYTGGKPSPSPEYPQEITNLTKAELAVAGKNLLEIYSLPNQPDSGISASMENDKSVTVNGMTTSSNIDIKIIGENTRVTLLAGVYTFSVDSIGFPKDCIFFIRNASDNTWFANTNVEKPTITISLDKPTIISECSVRIPTAGTKFSNARIAVQLEVGGKATGYTAPATKALTPIDLKGNELCSLPNGVKDEVVIDAEGNVSLIKRTKQYDWNCAQIIKGTGRNYAVDKVLDIGANYTGLVAEKAINADNNTIGICYVNQKMIYVTVPESVTTKEQANQLYGGMKVIYQLAEPQTIPLGKVELPALPEATSNVWNDGNIPANVYINYLKDVNIAFADLESKLTQAVVAAAANL